MADSGSRGNQVGLARARVLSRASVGLRMESPLTLSPRRAVQLGGNRVSPARMASPVSAELQTASLHRGNPSRGRVLSRVSAVVPRDVLLRGRLPRGVLDRVAQ